MRRGRPSQPCLSSLPTCPPASRPEVGCKACPLSQQLCLSPRPPPVSAPPTLVSQPVLPTWPPPPPKLTYSGKPAQIYWPLALLCPLFQTPLHSGRMWHRTFVYLGPLPGDSLRGEALQAESSPRVYRVLQLIREGRGQSRPRTQRNLTTTQPWKQALLPGFPPPPPQAPPMPLAHCVSVASHLVHHL